MQQENIKKIRVHNDAEFAFKQQPGELGAAKKPPLLDYYIPEKKEGCELIRRFFSERCFKDPKSIVSASLLYGEFLTWLFSNKISENPISQKRFGTLLRQNGEIKLKFGVWFYKFINIKPKTD
ncbi:MAG: hypothetical protein KKD92_14020 [Proteobacteria bacterium]|nr:hypothetical protein [Pseudomonadota bacterium]